MNNFHQVPGNVPAGQSRHTTRVSPLAQHLEASFQFRPIPVLAGLLLLKHLFASSPSQGVKLKFGSLVLSGNAGVADARIKRFLICTLTVPDFFGAIDAVWMNFEGVIGCVHRNGGLLIDCRGARTSDGLWTWAAKRGLFRHKTFRQLLPQGGSSLPRRLRDRFGHHYRQIRFSWETSRPTLAPTTSSLISLRDTLPMHLS